jgi:hypothetical protein
MSTTRILAWLSRVALTLGLAACLGQQDDNAGFSLAVTDAPVDGATSVVVQFAGVSVKAADGTVRNFDFNPPVSIDLLALNGGGSELLLDNVSVPAGAYSWVQFRVNAAEDGTLDSYITLADGSQHELAIPSGAESGLKLSSTYAVPASGIASFTVDFDLRKSVSPPQGTSQAYELRPALRIVDNARAGSISGTVDNSRLGNGCTPAVYVFSGAGVTPDDIDGSAPDPIASGAVKMDPGSGAWRYNVAYLNPGSYTVAFTCGAASDNPLTSEDLVFVAQDAVVTAGQGTTADFPAPTP